MQAFLFYIDDWLSSKRVESMDAAEERGYLRLLIRSAKEHDCGLPDDDAQLAIMSLLNGQWKKPTADKARRVAGLTSGQKLRECFTARGGRLYNERLLKEFENQQRVRELRVAAGRNGGRPRKANGKQNESKTKANGKQNESNARRASSFSSVVSSITEQELLPRANEPPLQEEDVAKWTLDEHYQVFASVARKFWLDLIDEDLDRWYWDWTNLDHNQRMLAIQGVRDRIAAHQDFNKAFKPTYFSRGEWKRKLIHTPNDSKPEREKSLDRSFTSGDD